MSKRYRFRNIALALGIAGTLLVSAYAFVDLNIGKQDGAARIERESAEDQKQRQYTIANCPSNPPMELVVCVANAYAAEREAQRAHEDLQAQQDSARAAFWMIALGGIQALLGIVGLVFLVRSLDHSANALREARDANNAAWQADVTTREVAEAQVRAYLGLSGIETILYYDDMPLRVSAYFKIGIINGGQTPARNISYRVSISWHLKDDYTNATIAARTSSEAEDLMAGRDRQIFSQNIPLRDDVAARALNGTLYFVVKGRVRYRPVVGSKFKHLNFAFHVERDGDNIAFKVKRATYGNHAD